MAGIGVGAFLVVGLGVEAGISYSKEKGFDIYITGGIGYGFGFTTKLTGNINKVQETGIHFTSGMVASVGAGLIANFDMNNRRFMGVSGLGAGGGVLHTGTITLRGLYADYKEATKYVVFDILD